MKQKFIVTKSFEIQVWADHTMGALRLADNALIQKPLTENDKQYGSVADAKVTDMSIREAL